MKLSVVIPTRDEAANIANCIRSFDAVRDAVEVIVVDNASTDATKAIAESLGARVFDKGPERNAQRNFGWRQAVSDWVLVLDADMTIPRPLLDEILSAVGEEASADAYWIPEVRTGSGIRVKARNFERSFYDGTCIDAFRLFRKAVLERVDGYDEEIIAGGEDWELDIRIQAAGATYGLLKNPLLHNEKRLTLAKMLEKKAYYTRSFAVYRRKWPDHPSVRRQFSPWYRFVGVFVEKGKWTKLVRHPVLSVVMMFERVLVGLTYLKNRGA